MKRIFHIISHFDVGGAERVAVNIAKSETEGCEYHIVELIRGRSKFTPVFINELEAAGIRYHRGIVPDIRFHYLFERLAAYTFPLWFIFLFIKYRPDVIHSHTEMPDLATYTFFKFFPRLLRRCRLVRTIHNTRLWTGMKSTGRRVEPFFITHNANVAISKSVQDNYAESYGFLPPIIYNGVAQTPQRPFENIVKGKTNILFAGRMEPQKGIKVLVEIIEKMSFDRRFHFHVIGDGSLRPFVEQHLSAQTNVTLLPPIHGLSAYLSSFDYLLMPSEFEGLSIMSLEASMEGLPVIGSGCPGLGDTLPDGWALNVPGNAADDYVRLLQDVIPTADKAHLAHQARSFAIEHFGVRRMQTAYENFYSES